MTKRILVAIPTNKYIEPETFKSLWDLRVPDGYTLDFQYFHGYSRTQILNLICEWAKRYDSVLFAKPNVIFSKDTILECTKCDADIVSVDDLTSLYVKSEVITKMSYPHFQELETEIVEKEAFVQRAKSSNASFFHLTRKTKLIRKSIF